MFFGLPLRLRFIELPGPRESFSVYRIQPLRDAKWEVPL
jgi:hypothetical protein